jgi:Domain of unknown function (DUF6438)
MRFWRTLGILSVTVLLPFALIAIAFTSPSTQRPDSTAQSDATLSTVTITLERTGCYGDCPSYVVTLKGDGNVEYQGRDNVKVKGPQHGTIKTEVLKSLIDEFERAAFTTITDTYSQEKCKCGFCTDMPTAITLLSKSGVKHAVDHYYGCRCAPKSLFGLEAAIDKAANVEQWTGDVSKSGPFGTTCTGD